jgi:hypothetical protein
MKILNLNDLARLAESEANVLLEEIAEPFRNDLVAFLVGETFMMRPDKKMVISNKQFKAWINKLNHFGFDNDINLRIYE